VGLKGDTGVSINGIPGVKGTTGETEPKNDVGVSISGDKGEQGDVGEPDNAGVPRLPGERGESGSKGDTGSTGEVGPPGFSIKGMLGNSGTQHYQ